MDDSQFLPTLPDTASFRTSLWTLYQQAETVAQAFAQPLASWIQITAVHSRPGDPGWRIDSDQGAVIHLDPTQENRGALCHEVFHSVFHSSLFHGDDHFPDPDHPWGEGFCDAFRFLMERKYPSETPSTWLTNMNSLCGMRYEEAVAYYTNQQDLSVLQDYLYPCSTLLRSCGGTLEGLRTLWFDLLRLKASAIGEPFLNMFFHYDQFSWPVVI